MTQFSIIIPLKNEEKIIIKTLTSIKEILLKNQLIKLTEIIIVINDTCDRSESLIKNFKNNHPELEIKILKSKPGYGHALLKGILNAKNNILIIFNADLIDENFIKLSQYLNDLNYDMVIGSKRCAYAKDKRPFLRKLSTFCLNFFLKITLGFQGTDTHGIKLLKRKPVLRILKKQKIINMDIIDTYIVIAMNKLGYRICELPIEVKEIRKSRFNNKRILTSIIDIFNLYKLVRNLKSRN